MINIVQKQGRRLSQRQKQLQKAFQRRLKMTSLNRPKLTAEKEKYLAIAKIKKRQIDDLLKERRNKAISKFFQN